MERTNVVSKDNSTLLLRVYNQLEDKELLTSTSVRRLDIRRELMKHLDEMSKVYTKEKKSAKFLSMANELFDTINEHFIPTIPPTVDEALEEIRETIFTNNSEKENPVSVDTDDSFYSDLRWLDSNNSTFAVLIVRRALKNLQLPIVQAKGWKEFAKIYCGLVMAA